MESLTWGNVGGGGIAGGGSPQERTDTRALHRLILRHIRIIKPP